MPETSEGFEPSGLEPNPAVDKLQLAPEKFDAQTAEIFLMRLNKALGTPERTTFDEALIQVLKLRESGNLADSAWKYFHTRIGGLSCGLTGTWEQALNELTAYIKNLHAQVKTLEQQAVKLTTAIPRLAPPANGVLSETDRAALIEAIPGLLERVERLEKLVSPVPIKPS